MLGLIIAIIGLVLSVISAIITFVVNRKLKKINDYLSLRNEELEQLLKEVK